MGQSQGVWKPNKFQIKMHNKIAYYLKCHGPKKKVYWAATLKEAQDRRNELAIVSMKYAKPAIRDKVSIT